MKSIIQDGKLTIDLYHGTSTLFFKSIIINGLGGKNPVKEWNLIELAKEVYELSRKHIQDTELYKVKSNSLKCMVDQRAGEWNWQHGNTYLSPSFKTGIRYAVNKRYGSEILTYIIDFIDELNRHGVKDLNELYRKNKKVFGLIDSRPAPILVKVKDIPVSSLLSENGQSAEQNLVELQDLMENFEGAQEIVGQQTNFRLTKPISTKNLEIYLINVKKYHPLIPRGTLFKIYLETQTEF